MTSRHDLTASATPVTAPAGAPNVLVVLLDDMGFGASSAFGGPCRMPVAEQLAADGLRYTRFHTTALCSPTRSALLTGRNHHSVGMGTVTNLAVDAPGYDAMRSPSKATLARTLSLNGYATGAFGKMHQTPNAELTPAGPFTHWPTQEGFDRFYGFLGGETDQFVPNLVDGTTYVDPPATPEEGYHFSEDVVDKAAEWIRGVRRHDPAKPWFCYLPFGATHAPFHVPEAWRDRYRGEFSHGWDEQRERTLARQQQLGIVPEDAELAPWAPGAPHWDELDDDDRRVAERLMEVYAAFAEHTDAQVGRLVEQLRQLGELDNTLVLYVLGDNGASCEGGLEGTLNETLRLNGLPDTTARILEQLDDIGSPTTYPHYNVGWALAMDTPYQWAKQVASHYGGTRNGLVVHWPAGTTGRGELRHQWHHVIDVAPTILEAAGLPHPTSVDGVPQDPIEGTSFAYSLRDAGAAERHTTQYFEMHGNRGIYHEGWTAVTKHRTPWTVGQVELSDFDEDVWELYDTATDWTQARDVAHLHPERLAQLQALFLVEAERHHVLPLDDRFLERLLPELNGKQEAPPVLRLDTSSVNVHERAAPNLKNTSYAVTAAVEGAEGADGVLVAQGGEFGGWALFVARGRLVHAYNYFGVETTHTRSPGPLGAGPHEVGVRFTYDGGGLGRGGHLELFVDGATVATSRLERTAPFSFSIVEGLDVGRDRGRAVSPEYPRGDGNAFTGVLHHVTLRSGDDAVRPTPEQELASVLTVH
ncbi:arylsulfatase [Nocardioides aequoreus]|uniref:arylsulfatase n=1 Tax=Nocardioides aequoreus TaxID=397278 RepID=UPI000AEE3815|nr:arylsulfatase [Nocardioides aequoreus]